MIMNDLPHGSYHRRIVLIPEPGYVRAAMEDESHHMEVTLFHDGQRVTDIQSLTHRIPWAPCPGASAKLRDLIGLPLRRMHQSTGHDAKEHCTHLFDLTRLAMARALVQKAVQYDVALPDRIDRKTRAELLRDGRLCLFWEVSGVRVTAPELFAGHVVQGAPIWPDNLDDDTIEAALVLRRLFVVARIRDPEAGFARSRTDPNFQLTAAIRHANMVGHCFSYHADRIEQATSLYSWRNFAERRDELLAGYPGARSLAEMAKATPAP